MNKTSLAVLAIAVAAGCTAPLADSDLEEVLDFGRGKTLSGSGGFVTRLYP